MLHKTLQYQRVYEALQQSANDKTWIGVIDITTLTYQFDCLDWIGKKNGEIDYDCFFKEYLHLKKDDTVAFSVKYSQKDSKWVASFIPHEESGMAPLPPCHQACINKIENASFGLLFFEKPTIKAVPQSKAIRNVDDQLLHEQKTAKELLREKVVEEFSAEQEANINKIFGQKFTKNVKKLRDLLIKRNEHIIVINNAEHTSKDQTDSWLACSSVINALKGNPILEDALSASESLIKNLLVDPKYLDGESGVRRDNNYPYSDSKTKRLFAQILVGISMACAGFKSGAAIGAVAGGGVFSIPSAVVGGSVGAFVGGIVGIFAGSKAHTFFRPNQAEEAIIYDKLVSINKGLENRPNRTQLK